MQRNQSDPFIFWLYRLVGGAVGFQEEFILMKNTCLVLGAEDNLFLVNVENLGWTVNLLGPHL